MRNLVCCVEDSSIRFEVGLKNQYISGLSVDRMKYLEFNQSQSSPGSQLLLSTNFRSRYQDDDEVEQ
jgi:hypothetical protein